MPFTQFTNLDFDEIKAQIKDFLRSNSNFTDFDFEGSNFSVLIDTLAYNTYINSFNANWTELGATRGSRHDVNSHRKVCEPCDDVS